MDNHKISDIIVTLSSLYELLLNIGHSFDIDENAEGFLKTLMLQKNLSFAGYYTFQHPNKMTKVYSIPRSEIYHNDMDIAFAESFVHNQFYILNQTHPHYLCIARLTHLPQNEFAVYLTASKSIIVLGKKNGSFDSIDLTKSELVLNKFGMFMESLESHHRIKDEIRIKEEQATIITEANEKLQKQNDDLIKYIRSNNELEKFAFRVSHDLKSPLNTIINFSKLLEKTASSSLTEQHNKFLAFIVDAGTQMSSLISGILDYSKISGDILKPTKINVYQLIEKTRSLLYHTLSETNGKIIVNDVPEFIIADETKIKQLFLNLIANALKFKKEDVCPEVIIHGHQNKNEFIFSISDNGIGIPKESQDNIFDLFSKTHQKRSVEGQGIGLSTCQQIVHQHNGKIWVESELDKGTTFHFTIQQMTL